MFNANGITMAFTEMVVVRLPSLRIFWVGYPFFRLTISLIQMGANGDVQPLGTGKSR